MKKFAFVAVAILALGGVFVYMNFGSAVKRMIEEAGSRATGTSVSVSGLDASIADKSASLSKLSVKNPKGFKESYLLQTKGISVKIADVSQKSVTISEIVVDGMTVTYELGSGGGTNLDAIKAHVGQASGESGGKGDDVKVIIKKLRITHAEVIPAIGAAHAPIPLPDMTINDIGSEKHPATPSQVASEIANKIMSVSSSSVLKAGLGNIQGAAGTALKGATKGVNTATGGIKGLFGK